MLRTSWIALTGASLLIVGCPDDPTTAVDTSGSDSSGGGSTSGTTAIDPSMTSGVDSTSTTDDPDPSTSSSGSDSSSGPPPATCGDDMVEGDEICDGMDLQGETCASQGFEFGGPLSCLADCTAYDTSNCNMASNCDGLELQPGEVCDGTLFADGVSCMSEGFDSGNLDCANDCMSFSTDTCGTCNNFVVDGAEVCDNQLLFGETCQSLGFDNGDLGCNADCLDFDTVGCGTCGNDIIEGTQEICDNLNNGGETCLSLGFDSGTLGACQPNCLEFDTAACGTCGNDIIDGDEVCDNGTLAPGVSCLTEGFDNGDLQCLGDCSGPDLGTCGVCGNGIIDGTESCDGAVLGGQTCASLGLIGGTLQCAGNCQFDFTSCDIPGVPFGSDSGYSGYALTPPVTTCDDISGTGTPTGLTDDSNQNVPIGFTFPLYGVDQTEANIQSNGTLRFGDMSYLGFGNNCLPTATAPSTNTLYVFWDDLNPSVGAGEVYYQTLGAPGDQRFVVQWDTANFAGDAADLMRFQVVLHQLTGQIDVCYVDTINAGNSADSGAEATAGIQLNSADGLQFSCNTADLVDGLQLLYIPN